MPIMKSKYNQLREIVMPFSIKRTNDYIKAKKIAVQIQQEYIKYLGADSENINLFMLNNDLLIQSKVENPKNFNLVLGNDNYWYFGLEVHYHDKSSPHFLKEYFKIGIITNNSPSIEFNVSKTKMTCNENNYESLFDALFNDSKTSYSDFTELGSRKIGFLKDDN